MFMTQNVMLLYVLFTCSVTAQDGKNAPRQVVFVGTIKGEISKVSDGGRKIEVKYKELITTSKSIPGYSTRGTSGKFRPPAQKELVFKEKNLELELRLLDDAVVRMLEGSNSSVEQKSSSKKRSTSDKNSDSDSQNDKTSKKSGSKSDTRKSAEAQHPGTPATPASLAKGQIVIVSVARENMPGFSRLIATTIYVLGEK